jgi:hypothetical protein
VSIGLLYFPASLGYFEAFLLFGQVFFIGARRLVHSAHDSTTTGGSHMRLRSILEETWGPQS